MRIFLSLLMLAGCTPTMPPGEAMTRVNREFKGQDITDFFISYGDASAASTLEDGGKIYQWVSVEPSTLNRPASIITYPGGHYASIFDNTNGEFISGYCKVSIKTDADDRIEKITLLGDSIGKYGSSRCAEIFGIGVDSAHD